MPKRTDLQSILIIGAGPITIGQACEFGRHDLGHLFDRFIALMQAGRDAAQQRQKKTSDDA